MTAAAGVMACGSSSTQPDSGGGTVTVLPEAPMLTCPADVAVSVAALDAVVNYSTPAAVNGTPPVTTTCTKPSGSTFSAGETSVRCDATDAIGRTATCGFKVTVTPQYQLRGTNFLAFGDSVTAGETAAPQSRVSYQASGTDYPSVLAALLRERYKLQSISMEILGEYGREVSEHGGEATTTTTLGDRLAGGRAPDAVLILEGVNTINGGDPASVAVVAAGIRADVRRSLNAGVKRVFLSTLLPQTEGNRTSSSGRALIAPMNEQIRYVVSLEGANVTLVDAYGAMAGQTGLYIGVDGLHPTVAGHQKLAETFFDAIKANFEIPLGASSSARSRR